MQPERSRDPASGPRPEPSETCPHTHNMFLQDQSHYYLSTYA